MSSRPGELFKVSHVSREAPFCGPLFMMATRGRIACTSVGGPERASP